MKKFIVIYRMSDPTMWKAEKSSPEDMEKSMKAWMAWFKKCGSALVEMGAPLGNGKKISSRGTSKADKTITGYSIIQAKDEKSAEKLLKDHPHVKMAKGCTVEVYEAMDMEK